MTEPTELKTIQYLTEGGGCRMTVDSGLAELYCPFSGASQGGRASTLKTLYDFWINDAPDPEDAHAPRRGERDAQARVNGLERPRVD